MADAVIDNPILNSPFDEPERHWKFERDGITNEIVDGRRVSSYFMPIPKSQRGGDQLQFETEWTSDRIEENRTINRSRERVGLWRRGGWQGVTPTTRRLLEYWTDPSISPARTPTLMLSRASGRPHWSAPASRNGRPLQTRASSIKGHQTRARAHKAKQKLHFPVPRGNRQVRLWPTPCIAGRRALRARLTDLRREGDATAWDACRPWVASILAVV